MAMTVSKATASTKAYVHTKKLQMAQKEAAWLASHGTLPDPEEELQLVDYSSMPFEE